VLEGELAGAVPVVRTSVAGTRIVGRLCVGEDCARVPLSSSSIWFALKLA